MFRVEKYRVPIKEHSLNIFHTVDFGEKNKYGQQINLTYNSIKFFSIQLYPVKTTLTSFEEKSYPANRLFPNVTFKKKKKMVSLHKRQTSILVANHLARNLLTFVNLTFSFLASRIRSLSMPQSRRASSPDIA